MYFVKSLITLTKDRLARIPKMLVTDLIAEAIAITAANADTKRCIILAPTIENVFPSQSAAKT